MMDRRYLRSAMMAVSVEAKVTPWSIQANGGLKGKENHKEDQDGPMACKYDLLVLIVYLRTFV